MSAIEVLRRAYRVSRTLAQDLYGISKEVFDFEVKGRAIQEADGEAISAQHYVDGAVRYMNELALSDARIRRIQAKHVRNAFLRKGG